MRERGGTVPVPPCTTSSTAKAPTVRIIGIYRCGSLREFNGNLVDLDLRKSQDPQRECRSTEQGSDSKERVRFLEINIISAQKMWDDQERHIPCSVLDQYQVTGLLDGRVKQDV